MFDFFLPDGLYAQYLILYNFIFYLLLPRMMEY